MRRDSRLEARAVAAEMIRDDLRVLLGEEPLDPAHLLGE